MNRTYLYNKTATQHNHHRWISLVLNQSMVCKCVVQPTLSRRIRLPFTQLNTTQRRWFDDGNIICHKELISPL